MGQAEYLNRREEYVAKAALMGMVYDWYDHTFNVYTPGGGDKLYDPDTMELLADSNANFSKFKDTVNERSQKYGQAVRATQPDHGQVGADTSGGND
jgi:hypothetical protein